jgi:putative ABC transport system permease protein
MEIYRPLAQLVYGNMSLVVRVAADPTAYVNPLRAAVREVDREIPLASVEPISTLVARTVGSTRLSAMLFGLFGTLGLVLAAIGIYGVTSYTVQQRRHEIGVRVALGASPGNVLAMIVRRSAWLSIAGITIGMVIALAGAGLMRKLLFGVAPHDRTTFVAIAAILAVVGTLGALFPALRATRIDPVTALRGE